MKPEVTIFICDDDAEVREALCMNLRPHGYRVSAFSSGPELLTHLDALDGSWRGVCLLDVDMHGNSRAGPELHAQLIARGWGERAPVLFLSGRGTIGIAVDAMSRGALNFIQKPHDPDLLVAEIERALKQEREWHVENLTRVDLGARWDSVSPQQRKVVLLVEKGLANKVIADRLAISERMVEDHRGAAFRKLKVGSAAELATLLAEARELGIELATEHASQSRTQGSPSQLLEP